MDLNRVEAILQLLQQQEHVGEIVARGEGWRVRARRRPGLPPLPPRALEAEQDLAPHYVVRAGKVGIFRTAREPVAVGTYLERGASVGSIDSMRILNPVTSEESGYVVDIHVEDGDPVEYGQELFVLTPEPPAVPDRDA
jgi:biotin carboxyl carrier protein